MNLLQHLLVKLSEEAAEVQQAALKCTQFGFDSVYGNDTNLGRLRAELNDMLAIVEMLNESHNFNFTQDRQQIEAKKEKVKQYLQYSVDLGFVNPLG